MTTISTKTSPELEAAIEEMAAAGAKARAAASDHETWLRGKSHAKTAAIARILREPNALNRRPHTVQSAEAISESDAPYANYLAQGWRLQIAKLEAEEAYQITQYRCLYLACGRFSLGAG